MPFVLSVWFLLAVAAGATGLVARLRPPAPQALLIVLTVAVLIACVKIPTVKAWVAALPLERLVALHVTRFVGIYFLVLYREGLLPFAFAVPGGWGDIIVAASALALLLIAQPFTARPWLIFAWNTLGFFDIVFVVLTAARLASPASNSMAMLLRLPLSLLPTFLVPLILATHILIFARLRGMVRAG